MINVAAVQFQPELLEVDHNLAKIESLMQQAAARGAKLAVFPECALTGYALSRAEAETVAEPIPGPLTQRLSTACQVSGLTAAVIGMLEQDSAGRLFNSAVVVGPEGTIGHYRKTHLPCLGVDRFLEPGETLDFPFETPAARLGVLICYDLRFPEPARVLALAGAQMIVLPTAWPRAATLYPDHVVQTRAAENGIFVVAANRTGEERGTRYLGRSVIAGPDGTKLAQAETDREQLLIAEIDPDQSDDKDRIFTPGEYELHLFTDRRPALYQALSDS